jgi:dTDP-4-amino-4,6-dideoxygalactose transaminase
MIPFVALDREYNHIRSDVHDAIQSVLEDQWFVLGDNVERFEQRFADYIDSTHAVSVNSGSDALQLALEALDIGAGDEVIVPSHTFVATANAVVQAGAEPVFVDVDPETYCIDPEGVRAAVTEDTAAVIPVHLYGHPADMDELLTIAEETDIAVVEDACQAHGATYQGEPVGSFGDIGCFSFYPTKNLGAYGDGGAVVTDDEDLATKIAKLRNVGQSSKYHHEYVGYNSRLDEIQAAVLNIKLDYLDEWNQRRREVADIYNEYLDDVVTPVERDGATHVYHLYVVRTEQRDSLREYLDEQNVGTLIHYPIPTHKQPAYADSGDMTLPVTERITDKIVSLPMHPWLDPEETKTVAQYVNTIETR